MTAHRWTRREVLERSTAAVAGAAAVSAPLVIPAAALGAEPGRAAPGARVGVALIGIGRQAFQVNLPQFLGMRDVQVVAVCDVDAWRMEQGRKRVEEGYAKGSASGAYAGCAAIKDFREVLSRKDVDAVMISTPDHWHVPIALAAAEAGKDVSLEKPITRTVAEGQALVEAMRRRKRVFRVDSEFRSKAHLIRLVERVRNGTLGKIRAVEVGVPDEGIEDNRASPPATPEAVPEELDYAAWLGPAPKAPYTRHRVHTPKNLGARPGWMRILDYCDGIITNWGTHFLDTALWCLDAERTGPVEIDGRGEYPPASSLWNVLKAFDVTYRMADGTPVRYLMQKPKAECAAYIRIEGEKGRIRATVMKDTLQAEPASLLDAPAPEGGVRFPLKSDKQDFIDAVKARGRTLEDEEVGHRVTSMCHLGHISIRLGRKLTWDPKAERFVGGGSDEANGYLDRPILTSRTA
jgi:myo-inositol 2-dehydrogenase/D-chiro-inositol 1-dehydrogenase